MIPTNATKAGGRYRYYVSTPLRKLRQPDRSPAFPPLTSKIPL
jgi:hypothetical protein